MFVGGEIMAEKLRVLMINGSPRANGNTSVGLKEMEKIFQENGVEAVSYTHLRAHETDS